MGVKILLRGMPGVGKTTLVKRILEFLPSACGFYTEEWREQGKRRGFFLVTLTGKRLLLASVKEHSPFRVGKYSVFPSAVSEALCEIRQGLIVGSVLVIDEIGKMELLCDEFKDIVKDVFMSEVSVLATAPGYRLSFVEYLATQFAPMVLELTPFNREQIFMEVKSAITR